jgi:hypothetical protein
MPNRSPAVPLAVLSLLMAAIPETALATVLYSTGFEPPTYSAGALPGQDGWSQDIGPAGIVDVQTGTVFAGSQAAAFHSQPGLPIFTRVGHFAPYDTSLGDSIVELEMRAFFSSSGDPSLWRPFAAFSGTEAIGGIDVRTDGQVSVFSATYFDTGVFLSRDTWYELGLSFDFGTRTLSASLDGVPVASGLGFAGSVVDPQFAAFTVEVIESGSDTMFFDDVTVSTVSPVPSPSTLWLMLAGGAVLIRSRRKAG